MQDVGFHIFATDDVTGPVARARSSLLGLGVTASTVSGGLGKMGQGALTAAKNMALIAIPVVAGLGAVAMSSTNAAKTFQESMILIQTQAGASADEVTNMSAAVLKLAPQVGTGPDELAAGLYHVESAGLRGSNALELLRVAAEGAKVGQADLESVTNALIASQQSGVKGVESMTGAMGTLNAIVGAGNMRMQDLTDAFGTGVLSTAKNYGVTIQSVGAALADMTDQGIPAVDAATRLNSAMRLMAAPTSKAISELKSIGLSSTQLAEDMRSPGGMLTAIQDLKKHLDESGLSAVQQAALLSNAFGGKQSGAILTLIGNVDLLAKKTDAVNQGAQGFGAAWDAAGSTAQEQQERLSASIDALKIQFGQELLPVEERVFAGLAAFASSPQVTKGMVDLGNAIAGMFSQENIDAAMSFAEGVIPPIEDFAATALPALIQGLQVAGSITKEAFDLFNQLPGPLKAAIIGGLAVNKLSGGLIGSGLRDVLRAGAGAATGTGGGVGSLLGVQKVFVTNMPPGGMGGAGGLPGEAAGAAGAASILPSAGEVALLAPWFGALLLASAPLVLPTVLKDVQPTSPEYLSNIGQYQSGGGPTTPAPYSYTGAPAPTAPAPPLSAGMFSPDRSDKVASAISELARATTSHDTSGVDQAEAMRIAAGSLASISHDTVGQDQHLASAAASLSSAAVSHDTSAKDQHAAAQTLDSAVRTWRDTTLPALGQDVRAGFQGMSPPNVSVTVVTTIAAGAVTSAMQNRTWYSGAKPD